MDPNETLRNLISQYQRGDYAEANLYAQDLHRWINRGGFMPNFMGLTTLQQQVLVGMLSDCTAMAQVAQATITHD